MKKEISRRIFIKNTMKWFAVTLFSGFFSSGRIYSWYLNERLADRLSEFYSHKKDIVEIGWKYLKIVPSEFSKSRLVELLCQNKYETMLYLLTRKPQMIKRVLSRKIPLDYLNDNTVDIEGWVLSKTEARLCAMAALNNA